MRKLMFDLERWKSVEFERPVISVYFEDGKTDLEFLKKLIGRLSEDDLHAYGILFGADRSAKQLWNNTLDLYLVDHYDAIFSFKRNRILAMSELFSAVEDLNVFVVEENKFHSELRNDLSIFVAGEGLDLYPIGKRKHLMDDIKSADIVISKDFNDNNTSIIDYYSREGIEIITDRNTFERNFIQKIRAQIARKKSDEKF